MEPTDSLPLSITTGSLLGFTRRSDVWYPKGETGSYIQQIRCFRLDDLPPCLLVNNKPEWWIAPKGAGFKVTNRDTECYSESIILGTQTLRNETLICPVYSQSNTLACVVTFTFKGIHDLIRIKPAFLKDATLHAHSLKCLRQLNEIKSCLNMTDIQLCLSHIRRLCMCLEEVSKSDDNHSAQQMYIAMQGIHVNDTVKSLCLKANVSYRTLNRFFSEHIGLSPKSYLQMNRLHAVCDHLALNPNGEWSEVIEQFGFYDQSHLIREFKRQIGLTPSAFRNLHGSLLSKNAPN